LLREPRGLSATIDHTGKEADVAPQAHPMQHIEQVITKCWEDETFKERLVADPAATLAAAGVDIPEGVTVRVAVDTEDVRTLVIPPPPTAALSDAELEAAVGGGPSGGGGSWACCAQYFDTGYYD
jgi:hypothetical protein